MKCLLCAVAAVAMLCAAAVRGQPSPTDLFSDAGVLEFRLQAPLQQLFAAKSDESFHVAATVDYAGPGGARAVLPGIEVSVRGHTSRRDDECAFPKLKLKLPAGPALDASVFRGTTSVKIGTHCGEAPDGQFTPKFGRLANEHSPLREAFVYRLVDAVGVPTLRARPARITYVDTSAPSSPPLVRYAMLLEDDDDARKRLGAAAEIAAETFGAASERFTPADAARVALAEAMIGNFDWCLKFTPQDTYRCDANTPLWNVVALDRGNGRAFPMIQDFDLAGMVTGRHPWFNTVYVAGFVPSRSPVEIETLSQVQRTRSLFPRDVLDPTRRGLLDRKAAVLAVLAQAVLDGAGRTQAQQYLTAFFDAIGSDSAFYRRVVAKPGAHLYTDASKTIEACRPGDVVPPGTPVNELQRTGMMLKVQVLDVLWHWAPPAQCPAIKGGTVWIDADAVSADYPQAR